MSNRESLDRLQTEVAEQTSAIDSVILFIAGLANRLREALMSNEGDDLTQEISDLADQLDQNQERLALAIAHNTVAEDDSDTVGSGSVGAGIDSADLDGQDSDGPTVGDVIDSGAGESTGQLLPDTQGESEMVRTGAGVTGPDSAVDTTATDSGLESVSPIAQEGLSETDNTVGSDNSDENGNAAA